MCLCLSLCVCISLLMRLTLSLSITDLPTQHRHPSRRRPTSRSSWRRDVAGNVYLEEFKAEGGVTRASEYRALYWSVTGYDVLNVTKSPLSVCMCVCVYASVYASVCMCVCACGYVCMCMWACVYVHVCMYACICACLSNRIFIRTACAKLG